MSLGIGEALTAIDIAITIFQKVKATHAEFKKMLELLEDVKPHVQQVQKLLPRQEQVDLLRKADSAAVLRINDIMNAIESRTTEASKIVDSWDLIGTWLPGAKWKYSPAQDISNLVKGNGSRLRELAEELETQRRRLDSWINTVSLQNLLSLLEDSKQQKPQKAQVPQTPQKPPSAVPKMKGVIFVDSYNTGRSVIAQSYLFLIREWTVRTKNRWPLQKWDSAGLRVRAGSAHVDNLTAVKTPMNFIQGGTVSSAIAISSLFDHKFFNYPYKAPIRERASQRKSRGLPPDLFSGFDFIFVFTREERHILEALREKLAAQQTSEQIVTANKRARILLLSEYGSHVQAEIKLPDQTDNEKELKEAWSKVTNNINTSVKAFLMQECGWTTPKKEDGYMQNGPAS